MARLGLLDLFSAPRIFSRLGHRIVFAARGTERRPGRRVRSLLPPARTRKAFPSMHHRRVRVRVYRHGRDGHHVSDAHWHVSLARVHDRGTLRVFLVARDAADRFRFRARRGRPGVRRRAVPILPSALARVRRGDPRPHLGGCEARDRRRRVPAEITEVRAVGGRVAAPGPGTVGRGARRRRSRNETVGWRKKRERMTKRLDINVLMY